MKTGSDARLVKRFEDLKVWQTGRDLVRGVYRASASQKLARDSGLRGQMQRAAVSIISNIAEGYERGSRKQQIEFCYLAKGSAGELRAQVVTAHDVGLLDESAFTWLHEMCEKCSRQLQLYIRHLRATRAVYPGPKYGNGPEETKEAPE